MKTSEHVPENAAAELPEQLLTTAEVATWLGIQRCTLEKARSTRLGNFPPFIRVGRAIRYRRPDVEAWLRQHAFNTDGSHTYPNFA